MGKYFAIIFFFCTCLSRAQTNVTSYRFDMGVAPEEVFNGKETVQVIRNPKGVLAYRLETFGESLLEEPLKTKKAAGESLSQTEKAILDASYIPALKCKVVSGPVSLTTNQISMVADMLTKKTNFNRALPDCMTEYAFCLEYRGSNANFTVSICFSCQEILVVNQQNNSTFSLDREASEKLRSLAKVVFPNEKIFSD